MFINLQNILSIKNQEYLKECLKILNNKTFNFLPLEIIENIFLYIDITKLFKLRKVCKYWAKIINNIINKHINVIVNLDKNKFEIYFNFQYKKKIIFKTNKRVDFYNMFYEVLSKNTIKNICLITYNYKFLKLIKDFNINILEFYITCKWDENNNINNSKHINTLKKVSNNIKNIRDLFQNTKFSLYISYIDIIEIEKNSILNEIDILNFKGIYISVFSKSIKSRVFNMIIKFINICKKTNIIILNDEIVDIINIKKYYFKNKYTLFFNLCFKEKETKYIESIIKLLKNNPIIQTIILPNTLSKYDNKLNNLKLEKICFNQQYFDNKLF